MVAVGPPGAGCDVPTLLTRHSGEYLNWAAETSGKTNDSSCSLVRMWTADAMSANPTQMHGPD